MEILITLTQLSGGSNFQPLTGLTGANIKFYYAPAGTVEKTGLAVIDKSNGTYLINGFADDNAEYLLLKVDGVTQAAFGSQWIGGIPSLQYMVGISGNIQTQLNGRLKTDGSNVPTNHIGWGNFRLYNVGDPASGIDVGDRDYNDARYILQSSYTDVHPANVLYVSPEFATDITAKRYKTIQSAINYAQSQSPNASNQWLIMLFPKKDTVGYNENITLQPYVHLAGAFGRSVRIYGTMTGGNINSRLFNLNWYSLGNFSLSNIRAKDCAFITDDPEATGFDLTITSTITKNCYFHASQSVVSGGNNTYMNLATSAGFDPQATDKGNHFSYNLPNFTGFILDI
jgi:hypothetical protein